MVSSRRSRPRRSHVLGGCSTCRRRHVKCDQKRPACRTCRSLGVTCEGFADQVLWMRTDSNEEADGNCPGARRHLYTEQSRLSMSAALGTDLVSGSIDASLAEVDSRVRDPERSLDADIVIGPFAVLDFSSTTQNQQSETSHEIGIDRPNPSPLVGTVDPILPESHDLSPASILDSLSHIDDFLHWSDLLSFSPDESGFPNNGALIIPNDLSFDMSQEFGLRQSYPSIHEDLTRILTPQQTPGELVSVDIDPVKDAPCLLKHFQDTVISQIMAIPCQQKSPWKILNVPAAVVTYGDSTFLGTEKISHARLANMYGLLSCSAIHLFLNPVEISTKSAEYWWQVASQAYQRAKDHLQNSLQSEIQGAKKAKYKDQLMAVCILIQYTIMSGQQQHARCFMIDAERLLRLRGLSKTRISKKARLLHHVYTWLRIVGESTFVLHNYNLSCSSLEALGCRCRSHRSSMVRGTADTVVVNEPNPRLDDFLRLETQQSDNDLNIDETKDQASGLHDIHLQDSRSYDETLYKQIYGIPETWLSLMSQTTRLANVLETFRTARESGKDIDFEAWEMLQRRSTRLENMICSFNLGHSRAGVSELQADSKPHGHMLEALNAALLIFFYRRIRLSHPAVLQGHVDNVITALEECRTALARDSSMSPGTAWPVFIAGCEAISASRRKAVLDLLDKTIPVYGFAAFKTARNIITEVWRKQDEHLSANRGEPMPSWVDVVKHGQTWPLFC